MTSEDGTSYILCSTPRTGSTFLCGLLSSSGTAGHPESYFRREDRFKWANRWGVPLAQNGEPDTELFCKAAVQAGSTSNGVFAARVMWGSMSEIAGALAQLPGLAARSEVETLTQAFGALRFLYIHREDILAQAVSWLKAEQTQVWHVTGDATQLLAGTSPVYDERQITELIDEIRAHNAAWENWFSNNGVEPLRISYEGLITDPMGTMDQVFSYLGLAPPAGTDIRSANKKMADELSLKWMTRYRKDTGYQG